MHILYCLLPFYGVSWLCLTLWMPLRMSWVCFCSVSGTFLWWFLWPFCGFSCHFVAFLTSWIHLGMSGMFFAAMSWCFVAFLSVSHTLDTSRDVLGVLYGVFGAFHDCFRVFLGCMLFYLLFSCLGSEWIWWRAHSVPSFSREYMLIKRQCFPPTAS